MMMHKLANPKFKNVKLDIFPSYIKNALNNLCKIYKGKVNYRRAQGDIKCINKFVF
jgi:hypothetical protein